MPLGYRLLRSDMGWSCKDLFYNNERSPQLIIITSNKPQGKLTWLIFNNLATFTRAEHEPPRIRLKFYAIF